MNAGIAQATQASSADHPTLAAHIYVEYDAFCLEWRTPWQYVWITHKISRSRIGNEAST